MRLRVTLREREPAQAGPIVLTIRALEPEREDVIRLRTLLNDATGSEDALAWWQNGTTLMRYLASGDAENCVPFIQRTIDWRAEHRVDGICDDPTACKDESECQRLLQYDIDLQDGASPVFIQRVGTWDVGSLTEIVGEPKGREMIQRGHRWTSELLRCAVDGGHKGPAKSILIFDLDGVGMHFLTASSLLSLMSEMIREDSSHFPNTVRTLFVLNAPFAFSALWSMVRLWLHEGVRVYLCACGFTPHAVFVCVWLHTACRSAHTSCRPADRPCPPPSRVAHIACHSAHTPRATHHLVSHRMRAPVRAETAAKLVVYSYSYVDDAKQALSELVGRSRLPLHLGGTRVRAAPYD